jgi:hypothetical protein
MKIRTSFFLACSTAVFASCSSLPDSRAVAPAKKTTSDIRESEPFLPYGHYDDPSGGGNSGSGTGFGSGYTGFGTPVPAPAVGAYGWHGPGFGAFSGSTSSGSGGSATTSTPVIPGKAPIPDSNVPLVSQHAIVDALENYQYAHQQNYNAGGWAGATWARTKVYVTAVDGETSFAYYIRYTLPMDFDTEGDGRIVPAWQEHVLYGRYNAVDKYSSFSAYE